MTRIPLVKINTIMNNTTDRTPPRQSRDIVEETEKPVEEGGTLGKYWKVSCAVVYLVICIFDFLIMPGMLTQFSENIDYSQLYAQVNAMENYQAQVALLNKVDYNVQTWSPLTLQGAGMFHIAFGAILTGVAMSQTGRSKTTRREREM